MSDTTRVELKLKSLNPPLCYQTREAREEAAGGQAARLLLPDYEEQKMLQNSINAYK